jgi:signal transduction histidine kinase
VRSGRVEDLLSVLEAVAVEHDELRTAHDELRRLDQLKSDFVSIASHELRTPISVVHGITSTLHLRGDDLAPEQLTELRATLFDQSSRLVSLADQLLDLSQLDAGAVATERARFRPREHIDTLLPRLAPDRLADIRVVVPPDLEVTTSPHGFERIVANLIANALRYGRPPVEVEGEASHGLRLVVQDHGDGVDPAFIPRLFERFSRADRATPGLGAGLGLSIARSFALALGGDLRYDTREPNGARFTLCLPS